MDNPTHPVWRFLRLVVMMTTLIIIFYIFADSFDATEIKGLSTFFLLSAGAESIGHVAERFKKGQPDGS